MNAGKQRNIHLLDKLSFVFNHKLIRNSILFLGVRGCHQRWVYCHHGNPQMSEIHDNSPRETTVGGHCHRTGRTRWTLCSMFHLTSFKIIILETLNNSSFLKLPERHLFSMAKKKLFSFPFILCFDLSLQLLDWCVFVYYRHQIQTV